MNSLLQKFGLTVNDFLKSTLTLLIFFALVALLVWFAMKKRVPSYMVGGFVVGAFYFLAANTKNNGGTEGDRVFSGGLNDIVNSHGGGVRDPNIYNNLDF